MSEESQCGEDLTGRKRFGWNVAFAWGGYAVNVLAGFIIPRLISDQLGQVTLGIWDFCWSVVGYFALVQLGLGGSVNRYVARYRAVDDREGLNRSVSTVGLFLKLAGALVVVITIATAWWGLPLLAGHLDGSLHQVQWVAFILGLEIAISVMLTVYGAVIVGCHRSDIHHGVSALSYGLAVIGMIVALLSGGGLIALALVHCVAMVLGDFARWRISRRVCPELQVNYRLASWKVFLPQAKFSAKSIIPSVATLISNQTSFILITLFLGPASLAVYARPNSLVRMIRIMAAKFGSILIPTASSLQARDDQAGLREALVNGTRAIAFLVVPAVVFLSIFGDAVIRIWMGQNYVYSGLVPIIALGTMSTTLNEPMWGILSGMNCHGWLAGAKLVAAICGALALWIALEWFDPGLLGVALCMMIPMAFVEGVVAPIYACRRLGLSVASYYRGALAKPVLCALPFVSLLAVTYWTMETNPWVSGITMVLAVAVLVAVYWNFAIPVALKTSLLDKVRNPFLSSKLTDQDVR